MEGLRIVSYIWYPTRPNKGQRQLICSWVFIWNYRHQPLIMEMVSHTHFKSLKCFKNALINTYIWNLIIQICWTLNFGKLNCLFYWWLSGQQEEKSWYKNGQNIETNVVSMFIRTCRLFSIVVTSSKYVGNFGHRSNLTRSFELVFLRFTDSSKPSQ